MVIFPLTCKLRTSTIFRGTTRIFIFSLSIRRCGGLRSFLINYKINANTRHIKNSRPLGLNYRLLSSTYYCRIHFSVSNRCLNIPSFPSLQIDLWSFSSYRWPMTEFTISSSWDSPALSPLPSSVPHLPHSYANLPIIPHANTDQTTRQHRSEFRIRIQFVGIKSDGIKNNRDGIQPA